jgi:hypothetical protein
MLISDSASKLLKGMAYHLVQYLLMSLEASHRYQLISTNSRQQSMMLFLDVFDAQNW